MPRDQGRDTTMAQDSRTNDPESPEVCSVCRERLRGALYCARCGPPPEPPSGDFQGGISLKQTFWSITLMVVLFAAAVIYKTDITFDFFGLSDDKESVIIAPEDRPKEPDFQLVHIVNVPMANVRKRDSMDSIVIMVLEQGDHVKLLEIKGKWSRISANDKTGWISNKLLTTKVE